MARYTETTPADSDIHNDGYTATYCPEDNKIRLYTGRVERQTYEALVAAGYKATPKQSCSFVATWSIKAEDMAFLLIPEDADIEDEDISPEERAEDRAERFAGYRDKRRAEASGFADRFEAGPDAHGYQNAALAERAAARHDRQRDKALCQWSKAEYWQTRTAGVIAHALHRSDAATRRGRILEIERLLRTYETGRYAEHLQMRLIYENGMLENEGGKAAEVEIVPGGWINSKVCRRHMGQLIEVDGWSQIVKVNKSNTTGRVVSVVCVGRDRFGWGSAEEQEKVREIKVNIERHGEDVYRAPTPEELEAFTKKQTARKERAKATAPAKPPLINPTMEDAQKLQDALNAQAPKEKPAQVRVMTQAEYSAQSKGAYARFETIGITERLRKSWKNASGRDVGGRFVVFQVRAAGFMPAQVIVLSDKPQKSIPWDAVADAVAQVPTREDVVSRLHLIEHVPAWYHDYTPEQVQALDDARYYGLGYMDSLSQFGITEAGREALKAYRETQAAPAPAAEPAPVGCLF